MTSKKQTSHQTPRIRTRDPEAWPRGAKPRFTPQDQADLENSAHADEDKLDKAVLTISATALGVCLAFIRDTISATTPGRLWFGAASLCFVASILCCLWSLYVGAQGTWAAIHLRNCGRFEAKSRWDSVLAPLNLFGLLFCTIGLLALTVFATLALP